MAVHFCIEPLGDEWPSETRKRVLDMATQDKLRLIGYHFGFPAIGNVAEAGDAYRFVPAAMDI